MNNLIDFAQKEQSETCEHKLSNSIPNRVMFIHQDSSSFFTDVMRRGILLHSEKRPWHHIITIGRFVSRCIH